MPAQPRYLRVRDKSTGHEMSRPATVVAAYADAFEVLDEPAVDAGDNPLPTKHAKSAPKSLSSTTPSGQKADLKKES